MKRVEAEALGDVLRRAIDEDNLTVKMQETRAISLWPTIVGKDMAARTTRPEVRRGVMYIGVPNASLRSELSMSRSKILNIMNKALHEEVIKDIRFIS